MEYRSVMDSRENKMDDEKTVVITTSVAVHTFPLAYLQELCGRVEAEPDDVLPWDVWRTILAEWIQDRLVGKGAGENGEIVVKV